MQRPYSNETYGEEREKIQTDLEKTLYQLYLINQEVKTLRKNLAGALGAIEKLPPVSIVNEKPQRKRVRLEPPPIKKTKRVKEFEMEPIKGTDFCHFKQCCTSLKTTPLWDTDLDKTATSKFKFGNWAYWDDDAYSGYMTQEEDNGSESK